MCLWSFWMESALGLDDACIAGELLHLFCKVQTLMFWPWLLPRSRPTIAWKLSYDWACQLSRGTFNLGLHCRIRALSICVDVMRLSGLCETACMASPPLFPIGLVPWISSGVQGMCSFSIISACWLIPLHGNLCSCLCCLLQICASAVLHPCSQPQHSWWAFLYDVHPLSESLSNVITSACKLYYSNYSRCLLLLVNVVAADATGSEPFLF